ncbi:MAG: hypothetical protein WCG73_00515 [Candidatus Moraniibacteriota bacterium]
MNTTNLRVLQWIAIIVVIVGIGAVYFLTRTKVVVTVNINKNVQQIERLLGSWSFNVADISDTIAYDRSDFSHDGIRTNNPVTVMGQVGQALHFDGATQYVSIGNVGSGIQSISFWIKTNKLTQKIIDLGGSANIEVIGQLIITNGIASPTIYIDGAVSSVIDTDWHFVTITTGTSINASDVNIGRVGSNYFDGALDEIQMYSGAITSTQINSLYGAGGPVPGAVPPPTISAITSGSPDYTGATISWTTNVNSNSYVEYGTTTGYGTTVGSTTLTSSHSVPLLELVNVTLYHFRVHSTNALGQEGVSSDNTFTTDGPAPVISTLSPGTPGYYTATITWDTDVPSASYVEYGTTIGYGNTVGAATLVTSHSVVLSGLSANTIHHFRVHSTRDTGQESISSDATFVTTPDL